MPRRKTDNKYGKAIDGRKHNGQKKGDKALRAIQKDLKMVDTSNQAKRNRVTAQATKGVIDVYGSEAEFWKHIAMQSKDSYNHLKLLTEYMVGKPSDNPFRESSSKRTDVPIINFFSGSPKPEQVDNTIDITDNEDTDE